MRSSFLPLGMLTILLPSCATGGNIFLQLYDYACGTPALTGNASLSLSIDGTDCKNGGVVSAEAFTTHGYAFSSGGQLDADARISGNLVALSPDRTDPVELTFFVSYSGEFNLSPSPEVAQSGTDDLYTSLGVNGNILALPFPHTWCYGVYS